MEADAASFRTVMLSTSFGFTSYILPVMPSMRTRTEVLLKVPVPLMVMLAPSLPGVPEPWLTYMPGDNPASEEDILVVGLLSSSFEPIVATEPVRFTFFCEPYPMTTTSPSALTADLKDIT